MLIAFAGILGGYDGSFDFGQIGADYTTSNIPFAALRSFPAILGALLAPVYDYLIKISYTTMRNLGYSNPASVLTAVAVTLDNGLAWYLSLLKAANLGLSSSTLYLSFLLHW